MIEQKLPENLRKYFWDVNFDELSLEKYAFFIAERVLSFGDQTTIKWLFQNISRDLIKKVIKESRFVDPKTRIFWNLKFSHGQFTF
jgi:hypothetical protein